MRTDRTLPLKLLWVLYGVMWVGGVFRLRDPGWAAPAFLLIAAAIVLLSDAPGWKPLATAAMIGFAFECVGVRTGFPFGAYVYTGRLGLAVLGVPLVIPCAWMLMFAFVRQFSASVWMGAALLTATDLVIDPVASGVLGYWRWLTPGVYFGVPFSNFAGWFLAGLLIFSVRWKPVQKNLTHRVLGATILLFFIARALP